MDGLNILNMSSHHVRVNDMLCRDRGNPQIKKRQIGNGHLAQAANLRLIEKVHKMSYETKNHQTFHLHILTLCRDSTSIHLVYNHVLSRLSYRNCPSVSSLVSTFSMPVSKLYCLQRSFMCIWSSYVYIFIDVHNQG